MVFGQQEYFGVPDRSQYLILDSGDDEYYEDPFSEEDDHDFEDEEDFEDDDEDED